MPNWNEHITNLISRGGVDTWIQPHDWLMMKIADLRNTILDMYRLLNLGGMIFLVIAFTHGYRHDIAWQEKHSTIMPDIGHDNSILHHFLNLGKIAREFADFIIHVIKLDEHMHADNPLSNHWLVWAEKPLEVSP